MNNSFSYLLPVQSVICLAFLAAMCAVATAEVTVLTTDDRVLVGEVDAETDEQFLWIRQQSDQISLTTSVPWTAIKAASVNGEEILRDDVRSLQSLQTEAEPIGFVVQQAVHVTHSDCQGDCLPAASTLRSARRRKVQSLSVDAFLVNFDRDVEPDGIELVIAALDERGLPVAIRGSLSVKLWGERIQPHGSLVQYENLQRWSQPVKTIDFDADGVASYALQFRTVRPAFDLGLHSEALVNVRLGVVGQGNFAASAPVQIRRFNPFRDRLEQTTGGRYLPDELTEEVRHYLPQRTFTRQLSPRTSRNR